MLDGTLLPAAVAATPAGHGARNTGALARLGWRRSAPVTEENLPLVERTQYGGMLRRNRSRLMWMVALGTAVAMLITGVLVARVRLVHGPALQAGRRHPAPGRDPQRDAVSVGDQRPLDHRHHRHSGGRHRRPACPTRCWPRRGSRAARAA